MTFCDDAALLKHGHERQRGEASHEVVGGDFEMIQVEYERRLGIDGSGASCGCCTDIVHDCMIVIAT